MGKRISNEKIEQINFLYYEIGIKKKVAEIVGCSVSTVTKYLIDNYIPKEIAAPAQEDFNIVGAENFLNFIKEDGKGIKSFCDYCNLTEEEWEKMKELQTNILY